MFTKPPVLSLRLALSSFTVRAAAMARDVWDLITDIWDLEARVWDDIP